MCGAHGGRAPQTKTRARERMEAMVDPALNKLRRLIDMADSDSVSLSAIKDILDRTGYKLPERIESDSSVVIRVEYEPLEREPVKIIEHHYEQLQNGASNGQSENGSRHHD